MMNKDEKNEIMVEAFARSFHAADPKHETSREWRANLMNAVREEADSLARYADSGERRFETIFFRVACAVAGIAAALAMAVGVNFPSGSSHPNDFTQIQPSFDEDIQALYDGDALDNLLTNTDEEP